MASQCFTAVRRVTKASAMPHSVRHFSASAAAFERHFPVVVVGAGTAGINVSHQLLEKFSSAGKPLKPESLAVVDGAKFHNYQPGWTLVGSGLADKTQLRRPIADILPAGVSHVQQFVTRLDPDSNTVVTADGEQITYDNLIVASGLQVSPEKVPGLPEALASGAASSIYLYDTCDKVYTDIEKFKGGRAIFTQPAGAIKCAGAPQKIMWMAEDYWRKAGIRNKTDVQFHTSLPGMFGVAKYSQILAQLAKERNVDVHYKSVLSAVDGAAKKATFKVGDEGKEEVVEYDFLHAVPPMNAPEFVAKSKLADAAGFVAVDQGTMQSTKYANVWSLGDSSSLPTSKTAAAVMSQTPILVHNFYRVVAEKKPADVKYDGYTSCPLLVSYGKLILAEFKYGGVVDETFSRFYDQGTPSRFAYHLKKDFFPWVYFTRLVNGKWYGRNGFFPPKFE